MPRPVLGESCTTSIKDFAIYPPHQKTSALREEETPRSFIIRGLRGVRFFEPRRGGREKQQANQKNAEVWPITPIEHDPEVMPRGGSEGHVQSSETGEF